MQGSRRGLARGALIAASLAAVGRRARAQTAVTPQELAERFAVTLSAHDLPAFAALFDESYVNHQVSAAAPAPPGKSAKEGTVAFFGARLAGMPDLSVTIESMVADDRKVAASFVYSGTHRGTYFGVAPTGRPLRFTSCDIFDVARGRFVTHWGMGDLAGVLAQLKA